MALISRQGYGMTVDPKYHLHKKQRNTCFLIHQDLYKMCF